MGRRGSEVSSRHVGVVIVSTWLGVRGRAIMEIQSRYSSGESFSERLHFRDSRPLVSDKNPEKKMVGRIGSREKNVQVSRWYINVILFWKLTGSKSGK